MTIRAELKALRELLRVQREADQRALRLQAQEYQRRLDELNHAHRQAEQKNMTYVPRETYEVQHENLRRTIDTVARLVYIGLGIALGGEFVLYFLQYLNHGR